MNVLAQIMLEIAFLLREVVGLWVTQDHALTSQGMTLVSYLSSVLTSLPVLLRDPAVILQRALLNPDLTFLTRELVGVWVTPGLSLTTQGQILVSHIASAMTSLPIMLTGLLP